MTNNEESICTSQFAHPKVLTITRFYAIAYPRVKNEVKRPTKSQLPGTLLFVNLETAQYESTFSSLSSAIWYNLFNP